MNVNKAEPKPHKISKSSPVIDFLKDLIDQRTELGVRKYGQKLHTFNGRNPLMDALQESIDLNQYLAQIIMEQIVEIEELKRRIERLEIMGLDHISGDIE